MNMNTYDPSHHDAASTLILNVDAARVKLGNVSRTTVYDLVKRGELTKVNIGARAFITVASIDDYLARLLEMAK
jgi:hypothetical protein